MIKNAAGQSITIYAYDSTTGRPKTGDAANITGYEILDGAAPAVALAGAAIEADADNAAGYYLIPITQTEVNGDAILFTAISTTSNIVVLAVPPVVYPKVIQEISIEVVR